MSGAKKVLMAAAGNAGGDPVYAEDVFNVSIFVGNGSTGQAITNGVDLSDKGGIVWFKNRVDTNSDHKIYGNDTGFTRELKPNTTSAISSAQSNRGVTGFNDDGFTLGTSSADVNETNEAIVAWTFAKHKRFFDVVTYTGNATARTIAHGLGSVPGMILVKKTDSGSSSDWAVYHRGNTNAPQTDLLQMNSNGATVDDAGAWNDTAPTNAVFSVGADARVNSNNNAFVAYLFAHNDDDGEFGTDADEDIIKCGSYTGNGTDTTGPALNLGFEPQYVMLKSVTHAGDWFVIDIARGIQFSEGDDSFDSDEALSWNGKVRTYAPFINLTTNGFQIKNGENPSNGAANDFNRNGESYIFMAIRRPHKPIETASQGFKTLLYTGNGELSGINDPYYSALAGGAAIPTRTIAQNLPFDVDLSMTQWRSGNKINGATQAMMTRKHSPVFELHTLSGRVEGQHINTTPRFSTLQSKAFTLSDGGTILLNKSNQLVVNWLWARWPGYYDTTTYIGTGANASHAHNLKAIPEMMWVKCLNSTEPWMVYHKSLTTNHSMSLNTDSAESDSGAFNETSAGAPTSSVFHVSNSNATNQSGKRFICHLFASVDGVSKVGSYTGTGTGSGGRDNPQTINCGFSNGASFVLLRRFNGGADWGVHDSTRGIIDGNDPLLDLNNDAQEITDEEFIDPHASGFIAASGTANAQNDTFIFYAVAI